MALDFDGSGSERVTYTPTGIQTTLDQVTIGAWLRPDSNNQYKRHFEFNLGGTNIYRCEFDDGWGFVFKAHWTSGDGAWSTNKISTNVWTHHLITYDSSSTANDPTIYLDGVAPGVTERSGPSGTFSSTIDTITLGAVTGGNVNHDWDGEIGEFAVWNRELTAQEAFALAQGYSPIFFRNGLVFYAPLYTPTTAGVQDRIIGTDGTISGTPVVKDNAPQIIYPKSPQYASFTSGGGGAVTIPHIFGDQGMIVGNV